MLRGYLQKTPSTRQLREFFSYAASRSKHKTTEKAAAEKTNQQRDFSSIFVTRFFN